MSNSIFTAMRAGTAKGFYGVTTLIFDAIPVWKAFHKLATTGSWTKAESDCVFDALLKIGILLERQMYPTSYVTYNPKTGVVTNAHQIEEMMDAVLCAFEFYKADANKRIISYFPPPGLTTPDLQRRFYAHLRTKISQCWMDVFRKKKNDPMAKVLKELNEAFSDDDMGHKRMEEIALETGIHVEYTKLLSPDDWVFYYQLGIKTEDTVPYLDKLFGDKMDASFSETGASVEIQFDEQILMVNISRSYKPEASQNEIYEAAKEKWVLSPDKLKDIHYVVAEAQGMVQEVFEVDDWYPVEFEGKTRYGFNGRVASDDIRDKYIHQSVRHLRKPGDVSPVHYYNLPE
jgi:hypothetical protein